MASLILKPNYRKNTACHPTVLEHRLTQLGLATPRTRNKSPPLPTGRSPSVRPQIRSVWSHNLEEEFALIRAAAAGYSYITIDAEFPSATHTSRKHYRSRSTDDRYTLIRANVTDHNLTQLGITLSDMAGRLPYGSYVWEFNFREFNIDRERYNPASVALLQRQKIDLEKSKPQPIDYATFSKLFKSSGLLCNEKTTWVVFGGAYDFGYLMKLLLNGGPMPAIHEGFTKMVRYYFRSQVFDTKHLMTACGIDDRLGLDDLAGQLKVERAAGKAHNAGSDSLLTCHIFHKMKGMLEVGCSEQYEGVICGLHAI